MQPDFRLPVQLPVKKRHGKSMGKRNGGETDDDQWDVLPVESFESLENVIG